MSDTVDDQYLQDVLQLGETAVPGMELALYILRERMIRAKSVGVRYSASYFAGLDDAITIIEAELYRIKHPEHIARITTADN